MKPPSENATIKALAILVESIQKENGADFKSSCSYPLSNIPLQQLATNADALSLARSHLHKEADKLIARVQHHRNLAAPIHQLPQEIFETILEKSQEDWPDSRRLLTLLQVGRLWYTTIVNCPQLWTRLDSAYPSKIARLIIMRSKSSATLSFHWHWAHPRSNKTGKEILEMAVANSARFKSMEFDLRQEDSFDSIRQLLAAPSTALESLRVDGRDKYELNSSLDGFGDFILSEGVPLQHLNLHHVSLNYDSPRFSGLITLRLDRSAVPTSVVVLVQMLSITSQLKILELRQPTRIRRVEQDVWPPSPLINLPCLTYFGMTNVPRSYCAALLSSLYATASRCYVKTEDVAWNDSVEELDAILWQPGSSQMAALLGANDDPDPERLIEITEEKRQVVVLVVDHGYYGGRTFSFRRPEGSNLVNLIGEYLHYVPSSFIIRLTLSDPLAQRDPLDLTTWSNHLMSLYIACPTASLSALEQLGQRMASSGNETGTGKAAMEDWVCPNLRYIGLNIPTDEAGRSTYVAALLSLIKKRWSGDDGLAPSLQPEMFELICSHSSHAHLQEVEVVVQKTVPSFQLYKRKPERPWA